MDQQEYEEKNRYFDAARMHLEDALHHLYECGAHLRYTGDDRAEVINCMLDGPKKMIEEWADIVEDLRQTWASENYNREWEDD